jgi:hypothetical protein
MALNTSMSDFERDEAERDRLRQRLPVVAIYRRNPNTDIREEGPDADNMPFLVQAVDVKTIYHGDIRVSPAGNWILVDYLHRGAYREGWAYWEDLADCFTQPDLSGR